jgi:hypothetical protein
MFTFDFIVERDSETVNLRAEFDIEPFIPGRLSGPPEYCYPNEGGFATVSGDILEVNEDGSTQVWNDYLTVSEIHDIECSAYDRWQSDSELDDYECDYDYDY